jgi:ABC-type Fe3+ transport system permease subunit
MLALLVLLLGLPLMGLLLPLARDFPLGRAVSEAARTFGHTLFYDVVAAMLAITLGFALALAAGRTHRLRVALVAALLLLFALPPALSALGWVHLATQSPAALDPLMRDRPLLAVHLGLRLLPVATVFALRAVGTASPSWAAAAAIHGVSVPVYLRRVLLPWALPALSVAGVLVALLAMADITSALLLHPPGKGTVPLAIFSVMANAPESFVAALCLVYVGGAATVAALAMSAIRLWRNE